MIFQRFILAGLCAGSMMVGASSAIAAPTTKDMSYSSQPGTSSWNAPQFDPSQGKLVAVRISAFGMATYEIFATGAAVGPADYSLTSSYYGYFGPQNLFFAITGKGSIQLAPAAAPNGKGEPVTASGGGNVTKTDAATLQMFTGAKYIGFSSSADLPKISIPSGTVKTVNLAGLKTDFTLTYTYEPALKLFPPYPTIPKQWPKKTIPKPIVGKDAINVR